MDRLVESFASISSPVAPYVEKADVAESTGNLYAGVDTLDGTAWIEAGRPNEPHYYRYQGGELLELPRPPVDRKR